MALESIKNITVDLSRSDVYNDNVTAMQGDNGTRYVYVTVLNNGQPIDLSNTYPVLRGTKSDGKTIFNQCEILNDKIVVELNENVLAAPGIGRFEIALYNTLPVEGDPEGNIITAFPFYINVIKSSFNAINVVSSDEYSVLNRAMENIPSIAELQEFEQDVINLKSQVGNHTVETNVPADAVFTDTTYENATSSYDGLESKEHYEKIEGIAEGAEVNQNAFSGVRVGASTISASSKTDSFGIRAGENMTVEIDAQNKEVIFSSTGGGGGETTVVQPSEYDNCINVNGEDIVVSKNKKLNIENGNAVNNGTASFIDTYVTADQNLNKFNITLNPIQDGSEPAYEGNGRNSLVLSFTTQTVSGVTFTVNADKTITLTGTTSADISLKISDLMSDNLQPSYYSLSCVPVNDKGCRMMVWDGSDNSTKRYDDGTGVRGFLVSYNSEMVIIIPNGADVDGIILKPMAVHYDYYSGEIGPWQYNDFIPSTNIVPFILRDYEYDNENTAVVIRKIKNRVIELNDSSETTVNSIYIFYDEIEDGDSNPCYYGMKINLLTRKAYPFKHIASYDYEDIIGDVWFSNKADSRYAYRPPEGAEVVYLDTSDEIDISSYIDHDEIDYSRVESGYFSMLVSYGNSNDDYKTSNKDITVCDFNGKHTKETFYFVDQCCSFEIEYIMSTNKIHVLNPDYDFRFGDEVQEDHYAENIRIEINPPNIYRNGNYYVGGYYGMLQLYGNKYAYDGMGNKIGITEVYIPLIMLNEYGFDYKIYCKHDSKYYKYNYYCAQYTGYHPNGFEVYSNYVLVAYRVNSGDTSYRLFYYDPDDDSLKETYQSQDFEDNSYTIWNYSGYTGIPVEVQENMNVCNICYYEDAASALAYAQYAFSHSVADHSNYSSMTARFYGGVIDVEKKLFYTYDYMPSYNGQPLTRDYDLSTNSYIGSETVKWFQPQSCYLDSDSPTIGQAIAFYRPNSKPYVIHDDSYVSQYRNYKIDVNDAKLLVTNGGFGRVSIFSLENYTYYPSPIYHMCDYSFDYYKKYEANLNSQKNLYDSIDRLKRYVDDLVLSAINGTY